MAEASGLILEQLRNFGVDTDKAMNTVINDPDLYITGLVAFALDDRFDRLETAMKNGAITDAADISDSIAISAAMLQLLPLERSFRLLHDAASVHNDSSALVFYSTARKARQKLIEALSLERGS